MLDTIRLYKQFGYNVLEQNLSKLDKTGNRYVLNPIQSRGLKLPRVTLSHDPQKKCCNLFVEVSVPKMLYGNNLGMVSATDITEAMRQISDYVSKNLGIDYKAETATVSRVDYCYNFELDELGVADYIAAIQNSNLVRMDRILHGKQTVTFQHKCQQVCIYDKYCETKSLYQKEKVSAEELEQARGILRLESRYLNSRACRNFAKQLNLPHHLPEHLFTQAAAEVSLQGALNRIGLASEIINNDTKIRRILNRFGMKSVSERLVGFLFLYDHYGKENAKATFYKDATWKRRVSQTIQAGVNLDTKSEDTLPALEIKFKNR